MDDRSRARRQTLAVNSAMEFPAQLSPALGEQTAQSEVDRALAELQFGPDESRPYALRRLRSRIEANLSGLLGPAVALSIVNRCLPFRSDVRDNPDDFTLLERRLDKAQGRFTGMAADLDNLRRHYRETLDNLPIGVCSVALDGEILLWNRSMEKITGIPARQVVGSLLASLSEPWRELFNAFIDAGDETISKREVAMPSSNNRWLSLHKTAQATADGVDDRVILVEDVTDYEMLQHEVLHTERLASIGRLAAGVAHEIGNPITGIACLAQNLAYETDTGEIRYTAEDILKQTERVTRIVESLVSFSHVGSGAGDAQMVPCNLADCIDEAVHLMQLDRQAREINFRNDCNRELLVLADSQRLLQVFINLLSNARDACNDGGHVVITAQVLAGRVSIDVVDDGAGIPPELLGRVLEPFFTTKDPGEGTGLGLALVYSIMEDMDGSMQIHSPAEPSQGSGGTRVNLQLACADYGDAFDM
jgi:PAS domain S-box-containing protein